MAMCVHNCEDDGVGEKRKEKKKKKKSRDLYWDLFGGFD